MDVQQAQQLQIEIAERKKFETLFNGQKRVLELVALGAPLPVSLAALICLIEEHAPGMVGSVLLLDEDGIHLRHGAAPSLPPEYTAAIDGLAIGPKVGSCGTAAYFREAVFVEDIATDPLWKDYKAVALPHGLRACWSTPIFDARRRVLGTFAMYYRQPALPQPDHRWLIEIATHTAAIAIGCHRTEAALRAGEERLSRLNRELLAIGRCNRILLRAVDEHALLNDVCRIVCEDAGYRMAWVGYAGDPDATTLHPVAWSGVGEGHLAEADIFRPDMEPGYGLAGRAIRRGEIVCIQDTLTDDRAASWRDSALLGACRSGIALPLKDGSEDCFGVLNIYSREPNVFVPDEIRLLEGLSVDLAFGITALRARAERGLAELDEKIQEMPS